MKVYVVYCDHDEGFDSPEKVFAKLEDAKAYCDEYNFPEDGAPIGLLLYKELEVE